ncbi:TIGR00282 family metallophosphoesterase [Acholeplasma sp. OttesenSCG-928-E16]|nr:TIGR00282 family metallophosphoesterase [Acholeplasma sp. OttesenSCG-928-E16]
MKILFFGDVYGNPGREYLYEKLDNLKEKYRPNIIIINGENIAPNGRGINKAIYKELMSKGISAITMGNWVFGNSELLDFIDGSNVVRPINFYDAKGSGTLVINFNGKKLLIINALGRTYMNNSVENPFLVCKKALEEIPHDYSFIDFHAEATSEKVALGYYLDGLASAIVGTHTHVQTTDDRILEKGTLYISDVGMTGPLDGVIGVDREIVINRFINGHAPINKVPEGRRQLSAVFLDLELKKIERIYEYEE